MHFYSQQIYIKYKRIEPHKMKDKLLCLILQFQLDNKSIVKLKTILS